MGRPIRLDAAVADFLMAVARVRPWRLARDEEILDRLLDELGDAGAAPLDLASLQRASVCVSRWSETDRHELAATIERLCRWAAREGWEVPPSARLRDLFAGA